MSGWKPAKDALEILKTAVPFLPKGRKHDELDGKIKAAEASLARSDALIAKTLGYKLCQCTFPPQIMLWKNDMGVFACPVRESDRNSRRS